MTSTDAADPSGLEDDESDFITIHFLSQQEPETVVKVKQRSEKNRRQEKERLRQRRAQKKDEMLMADASAHSSLTSLSQSYSRLPEIASNSWLNLRRLNTTLLSSSESVATASDQSQQQPQQQQDFLSTLFDKLSGSLTVVSETPEEVSQDEQQQERDQERLTYKVYRVSTRRFKDSPPPPEASTPTDPSCRFRRRRRRRRCSSSGGQQRSQLDDAVEQDSNGATAAASAAVAESDYSECDEFDATEDEDGGVASGAEVEKAETPEIVRFLWAHQAKCWPPPLMTNGDAADGSASIGGGSGGMAQFGK
uniref:BZIP domain-containing protein n=1 Tax=Macrostomum lignano TaxID=282301 RepID=A0A1I8FZQ9_9PLAT